VRIGADEQEEAWRGDPHVLAGIVADADGFEMSGPFERDDRGAALDLHVLDVRYRSPVTTTSSGALHSR